MNKARTPATAGKSALRIVHAFPQFADIKRVVDAHTDVLVEVTPEDNRKGKAMGLDSCALVKALERKHDGAIVSKCLAYLIDGKTARRYKVGRAIHREIVAFDRTKNFQPGVYYLMSPSPADSLGPLGRAFMERARTSDGPKGKQRNSPRNKRRISKLKGVRTLST